MHMPFDLSARLAERQAADLFRQRPLLQSPQGPLVQVDGQHLLAFCSNDYLGMGQHPDVLKAMQDEIERTGDVYSIYVNQDEDEGVLDVFMETK